MTQSLFLKKFSNIWLDRIGMDWQCSGGKAPFLHFFGLFRLWLERNLEIKFAMENIPPNDMREAWNPMIVHLLRIPEYNHAFNSLPVSSTRESGNFYLYVTIIYIFLSGESRCTILFFFTIRRIRVNSFGLFTIRRIRVSSPFSLYYQENQG